MNKNFLAFKQQYQGKKVLIMGLGLQGGGIGDANLLAKIGARVTITDLKTPSQLKDSLVQLKGDFKLKLGGHDPADFKNQDLIIKNPAVKPKNEYLKIAQDNHIEIKNSVALFAKFFPGQIIGITGTRGKSTTAQLIYEVLKSVGQQALLGGNVSGQSTLSLLEKSRADQIAVLELSSWILRGFAEEQVSPQLAVITNIYQDHLDYYNSMADYIEDKKAIFKYQKPEDVLIMNKNNPALVKLADQAPGKLIWFTAQDWPDNWSLSLLGQHNQENAAASLKALEVLGVDQAVIRQVISQFSGLPHRLENLGSLKGVEFINDTTSTTPKAAEKALEAIDKPIILLAGGNGKNLDLEPWVKKLVNQVKAVVLLEGSDTDKLEELIKKYGGQDLILTRTADFEKAVNLAYQSAQPKDVVLLSPGCTSFGTFLNEFDRGNQFKTLVKKLQTD